VGAVTDFKMNFILTPGGIRADSTRLAGSDAGSATARLLDVGATGAVDDVLNSEARIKDKIEGIFVVKCVKDEQ
jgi:hypothetical protein